MAKELIIMSGPGGKTLARDIYHAQRVATPDMTLGEFILAYPVLYKANTSGGEMAGWLSDVGGWANAGTRAATKALGFGEVGSKVTDVFDSVGHAVEDKIGGQAKGDVVDGVLDALGGLGSDIRSGHALNSIFASPIVWVVLAVILWFFLKGRR